MQGHFWVDPWRVFQVKRKEHQSRTLLKFDEDGLRGFAAGVGFSDADCDGCAKCSKARARRDMRGRVYEGCMEGQCGTSGPVLERTERNEALSAFIEQVMGRVSVGRAQQAST